MNTLEPHDRLWLDRPLEEDEIRRALRGMNPHGAPGPDGLTAGFWNSFQDNLTPWLTGMANCIGTQQTIPKSASTGLIRLIYKGKGDPMTRGTTDP